MAAVQNYLSLSLTGGDGGFSAGGGAGGRVAPDQFPAGLRVLVVDDDRTCLRILEKMLTKCLYEVTMCFRATEALSFLRERKGSFDVVISDVHMPDMDGYKLLELVGLEMDLPVIMMSGDGRTSAVMKGIKHGACDYLIKPVRIEELQNIWQHVVRKKWNENKENDNSGSAEDSDRNNKKTSDETEYCSSVSEGTDGSNLKSLRKRKDSKDDEEDGDMENDDPSASKKPRVVWSVELHQQFVNAVNQLGIDKAVPKRILELMNVPGLTRENVASHLQKFRLYLKRISVAQHQGGMPSSFGGSVDSSQKLSPIRRLDFQALAATGQIPPQTLSALQCEFGRPKGSLVVPGMDSALILSSSVQGSKCLSSESGPVAFGQPLMKCQTVMNKKYSQPFDDMSSGFTSWLPGHLGSLGASGNLGAVIPTDSKMLVQMLHRQQQQSAQPESSHIINVQPSCLVVPSQVQNTFQSGNSGGLIDQASYNVNSLVDYDAMTQTNNMSTVTRNVSERNLGVLTGYSSLPTSNSPALSSGTVSCEKQMGWQVPNSSATATSCNRLPEFVPNLSEFSNYHDTMKECFSDHILGRNLGFVGKQTSIPSRYAVDEMESLVTDMANSKNCVDGLVYCNMVKQELNMDIAESGKGGLPGVRYSPSDLMGVLSK